MALKRKRFSLTEDSQENKRIRYENEILTITTASDKIIYSEIESLDDMNGFDYASQFETMNLLPTSIETMINNIEQKNHKARTAKTNVPRSPNVNIGCSKLWVDKYSPKKFRDLLSNEKTNRDVLKWIKRWDKVVFSSGSTKEGRDTRPEKKILLLSGAPGIGKTTLAHILAKHAGYNPMEVNASDDRTRTKFKPKIEAAIENRSVFGDCKPNLLIIDEIDGIASSEGASVADTIIEIALDKKKTLRRPIICICNDPYAPALRNLRKHALLFKLEKPKTSGLCCRLLEICKAEGVKTDAHTLSTLCSLANNDIRSCLNSLQFIRNQTNKITTDLVKSSTFGQKDISKSVFNVWSQIFHPQNKKRAFQDRLTRSFGVPSQNESSQPISAFHHLNDLIVSHGNIDTIIEGCHSHFPTMKYLDTTMKKTAVICDSLAWASDAAGKMPKYSSFGVMKISLTIPQDIEPQLHFPVEKNTLRQRRTEFKNIVDSFLISLKPEVLQYIPRNELAVDFYSYLYQILTPNFRVANETLLNDSEKVSNNHLAQLMSKYGLGYSQEMEFDAVTHLRSLSYKLDPPIDKLVVFPTDSDNTKQLTNAQKKMLFLALEKEKYRANYRQQRANYRQELTTKKSKEAEGKKKDFSTLSQKANEKNDMIARNAMKREKMVETDFFGRAIGGKGVTSNSPKNYSKYSKHSVFFKFQEGYSNAVKRTVSVKDFL